MESLPARRLETPDLRKLYICTDEATLEIVSIVASTNDVGDAEALPDLLQDIPVKIEQVSADGAYVREENLQRVRKVRLKEWKRESNYHHRSLSETQVFCFKKIFGDRLQTRRIDNQFKELMLKGTILNRMIHLGMPGSIKVIG